MEEELIKASENRLADVSRRLKGEERREEKRRWVIGVVLNNTKISTRDKLLDLGYEAYASSKFAIEYY